MLLDEYHILVIRQKQILQNEVARAMTEAYHQIELKNQRILNCIEADPRNSFVQDMSINVDIRVYGTTKFWKLKSKQFINKATQKLKRSFTNSVQP